MAEQVLSRGLRDRRAVARYAGLTGAPDESGAKQREKGLAKAGSTRETLIVALARKLLIALWRLVATGEAPEGLILRPAG